MKGKAALRKRLSAERRAHVAALSPATRALLLMRPPRAVVETIAQNATIGLYAEISEEAPATRYAQWFYEQGHPIALPWFADRGAAMEFRRWDEPFDSDSLELGPWGVRQPLPDAERLAPDVAFVPLVGFTADGARLGMGAGHYDRWLEAHPATLAIGLAWDCQEVPFLPTEPHDRPLSAVITPTRLLGPFE